MQNNKTKDRKIVPSIQEIWKQMVWVLFLGGRRSEAAVNYIFDLLVANNLIDYDDMVKFRSDDWDDWDEKVRAVLEKELSSVRDEDREDVLKNLLSEVRGRNDRENPLFYIRSAMRYFREEKIDWQVIEKRTRTEEGTVEFMREMYFYGQGVENYKKITGFGASKAALWLYSLGKALGEVPPTSHVKNFINFDVRQREYNEAEREDDVIIAEMKDFVEKQVRPKIPGVTVKDVQTTVWLWKSCQGLLSLAGRGLKSKLTAEKMAAFVKKRRLNYVTSRLADLDKQFALTEELMKVVSAK